MTAYGYIRKSVVHDPTRMLSLEMQEGAIRALAARHDDGDVTILSDLDVSGKKDRSRRPGWDELLTAVEQGNATSVYAYSLSRFARSVAQLAEFFDLCERKRVPIRVDRDQIDTSTATGKLVSNVLASLAQFESDVASERVKDAFAAKRARDTSWSGPGNRPYGSEADEDTSVVVAAFREAGSFDGAARALNAAGTPTRKVGGVWHGSTVRDIVQRVAPDEIAPGTRQGAKAGKRDFRLAFLLRCPTCGRHLTASLDKRRDEVRYYCHRAGVTPHPRAWVSESKILPLVAAEAERAALLVRRRQVGSATDEAVLRDLASKRDRVIDVFTDGLIDKPERDRRLADIASAESKLSARRWMRQIIVPPDIANDEPARVNAYLRRLLDHVVVENMATKAKRGPSHEEWRLTFTWRESMIANGDTDEAA